MQKKFIVITSINPISIGIEKLIQTEGWSIVIIGDKKTPDIESRDNLVFISVEDQLELGYDYVQKSPYNHYARKNIGYLYAIENGADVIYETDDDNIPYPDWDFPEFLSSQAYQSDRKFVNIYQYFTKENVWPRGFPLDEINQSVEFNIEKVNSEIAVWQGLSNKDPDVDAIYRLVSKNREIIFENKPPIAIKKGQFVPFNSQNTLWTKLCFPFLYLPGTVKSRFTDILRGYIAQRLFWEHDLHLGFTAPTNYQNRNHHDLMKDFNEELEMYLKVKSIVDSLIQLDFQNNNPCDNLLTTYQQLSSRDLISDDELNICQAWISDYQKILDKLGDA
jgi:hypothetical protein